MAQKNHVSQRLNGVREFDDYVAITGLELVSAK